MNKQSSYYPTEMVFVYGTLLSAFPQNYLLNHDGIGPTKYIGTGKSIDKNMTMRQVGNLSYPAVAVDNVSKQPIIGEVYEVGEYTLRNMDSYEGYPHLYNRIRIKVRVKNKTYTCWIYVEKKNDRITTDMDVVVPNNDWEKYYVKNRARIKHGISVR